MTPQVVCVPPPAAPQIWPHAADLVAKAMQRGEITSFRSIEAQVLSGRALLWVLWTGDAIIAAAVTSIHENEYGRVCELVAFGGDLQTALPGLETIEDYAHEMQCRALRLYGPRAWKRILPADYDETAVVLEKVL